MGHVCQRDETPIIGLYCTGDPYSEGRFSAVCGDTGGRIIDGLPAHAADAYSNSDAHFLPYTDTDRHIYGPTDAYATPGAKWDY